MSNNELEDLMNQFRHWASTAGKEEDGWQTEFPRWHELMNSAAVAMHSNHVEGRTLDLIAECWAASEETEDLLESLGDQIDDCWSTISALSKSSLPACRWQIYEIASKGGEKAEGLLRQGLSDSDPYARRRAIISLSRLRPADAPALAKSLMQEPDPYIRQASISMILAVEELDFRKQALQRLATDPIDHVRVASQSYLAKLR